MFTKKKIILGIVLLAVAGGFFYYRSQSATETGETEKVRRGDIAEMISVTGELVPVAYADIAFAGAGIVESLSVQEGDTVEAGHSIATLESDVLESQLREARIAQAIAEENEKLARHGWDDLKQEERNAKKLASEQAREDVRTAQAELETKTLFAPLTGTVSKLNVRVGELITLGTIVARVAKESDFVIEARVPESDIVKITLGMGAEVTFDALSSTEIFGAEVIDIERSSTVIQDVVSYVVKFRLEETDVRLKDGMTVNIDVATAKRDGVLILPFRALTREGEKTFAEVKRSEGQFEKVEVVTGLEGDEGMVEIRSGLQEGDEVSILATQKK